MINDQDVDAEGADECGEDGGGEAHVPLYLVIVQQFGVVLARASRYVGRDDRVDEREAYAAERNDRPVVQVVLERQAHVADRLNHGCWLPSTDLVI